MGNSGFENVRSDMKEAFLSYEEARQSGEFNMIMDAHQVQKEYGITSEDYWYIVKNYSKLTKKYLYEGV